MQKSDKKPSENLEQTVENLTKKLKLELETFIQEQIDAYTKSSKMQLKGVWDALETQQNTMNYIVKEINYKLGNLKGAKTKQQNEMLTFGTIEEAKAAAEVMRQRLIKENPEIAEILERSEIVKA